MPVFQRYIGLAAESSYGVAVAPTYYLDMAGESLELKKETRLLTPARAIAPDRSVSERRTAGGTADVLFGFEALGKVLKSLIGAPVTTNLGSGAFQHVFTPSLQTTPGSLTLEVHRDAKRHRYTGAVPVSARYSSGGLEHWGLSLGWIAADESEIGSTGSVNDTDFETPAWSVDPAGASAAGGPFSIVLDDGSTNWSANATRFELDLRWNRSLRYPERAATATGFITRGTVPAVGRLAWFYSVSETTFLYDAYRNQTDVSATIKWNGALIGGGFYRQIQYHLPRVRITGRTPTIKSAGVGNVEHEIPFEALYSSGSGYHFKVQLVNTTASY